MKKILWIVVAVVALGVLAFIMFYQNSAVEQGEEQAPNKVIQRELEDSTHPKPKVTAEGKAEQADKVTHERKDEEQVSPKLRKMFELAKMQLADVKLVGRVVDQHNKAVAGVAIKYNVAPATFGYGGGYGEDHYRWRRCL